MNCNLNVLTGFTVGATGIYTNAGSGTYFEFIGSSRPFLTYTAGFIPTVSSTLQLRFATPSFDNVGPAQHSAAAAHLLPDRRRRWRMIPVPAALMGSRRAAHVSEIFTHTPPAASCRGRDKR